MAKIRANPRFRAVDPNTGASLVGGKLFTFIAGTTTNKATFADQAGLITNPNPVQLDGNGEANVWLGAGGYKFKLTDAFDVELWTVDGIQLPDNETLLSLIVTGATTLATVTASGQIISTVTTGTAPLVVSSTTKVANLNADKLDGKDWTAPDPIGATTPNSVKATTVEASGDVTEKADGVRESANAAQWKEVQLSEEITLDTGAAFTDSAGNLLPANSIIESVVVRVTESITTAANWSLGDATQAARFLAATTNLALGDTEVGLAHKDPTVASADLGPVQSAAAKLRITLNANPGAGKLRVTVFAKTFVPPTS